MKKRLIGLVIFIILIFGTIFLKSILKLENSNLNTATNNKTNKTRNLKIANFTNEEIFLNDNIADIIGLKYNFNVDYKKISSEEINNQSLLNEKISNYDLIFSNKEVIDNYYKTAKKETQNNIEYDSVLNTPLVIYSWDKIVDTLINENIVTEIDGVYFITDMNKLINYILEEKQWSEIGLSEIYGNINIISENPNTSSGRNYYEFLLILLSGENINYENNFSKINEIYKKSEYLGDEEKLFDRYARFGMTAVPLLADLEKSIIEFKNTNPDGFDQIKSDIRILYPIPTIIEEYYITSFTENGNSFKKIFFDKDIQKIIVKNFGLRNESNTEIPNINGLADNISDTVQKIDNNTYENLISYINENK